jgi:hypothetical protein
VALLGSADVLDNDTLKRGTSVVLGCDTIAALRRRGSRAQGRQFLRSLRLRHHCGVKVAYDPACTDPVSPQFTAAAPLRPSGVSRGVAPSQVSPQSSAAVPLRLQDWLGVLAIQEGLSAA